MSRISDVDTGECERHLRIGSRFMKKKCWNKRERLIKRNIARRKVSETDTNENASTVVEGRRIVHIQHIAKQLWCTACKNCLTLENIESERRYGLTSMFAVRCHNCLEVNEITTDKRSEGKNKAETSGRNFVTNSKIALGALHAGIGFAHVNKLLACLNIPPLNWKTFKTSERIVGPVVEAVAKEVCRTAAEEERTLVYKNLQRLKTLLPDGLDQSFLTPDRECPNGNISHQGTVLDTVNSNTEDSQDVQEHVCGEGAYNKLSGIDLKVNDQSEVHGVASAIAQAMLVVLDNDLLFSDSDNSFQGMFDDSPGKQSGDISNAVTYDNLVAPSCSTVMDTSRENNEYQDFVTSTPLKPYNRINTHPDKCNTLVMGPDQTSTMNVLQACQEDKEETDPNEKLRFMVSFDMGWSRRANGKSYDSLNGYGAIIGFLSRKVLDFSTRNRKCKKCLVGKSSRNHDCRLNFQGSAKAMEPDVATDLCTNSNILKDCNMEVGILCGDDDSATIAAVRAASSHKVIKLSDVNHTEKGLGNALYEMAKKYKELNTKSIEYLKRCFAYALAQNKGHPGKMADAMKVIPKHSFNDHSLCSDWCGYIRQAENYDHTMIPGGFKDPDLHTALTQLFDKFAENSHKYAHGCSSQGNECLNAIMAHHAKKMYCYSLSESADYRFACAVSQKNVGEEYIKNVSEALSHSPTNNASIHIARNKTAQKRRLAISNSKEGKRRRLFLKQERAKLRTRKEQKEGVMYESDLGLLCEPALNANNLSPCFGDSFKIFDNVIVYFDIETGGFSKKADILQIAAKSGENSFSVFLNPVNAIAVAATAVHGFTNENGELHFRGACVPSVPRRVAITQFRDFLENLHKKCILVAHNAGFDAPRILNAIKDEGLLPSFQQIVQGFSDTLPLLKKLMPQRKGKGQMKLTTLAHDLLGITAEGAHNALNDVYILEQVVHTTGLSSYDIHHGTVSVVQYLQKEVHSALLSKQVRYLAPLEGVVSLYMRKRMAVSNVTFNLLIDTFVADPNMGIQNLLAKTGNDGKPSVTRSNKVIRSLNLFLSGVVHPV